MTDDFSLEPIKMQALAFAQELRDSSKLLAGFGLALSENQIQNLAVHRAQALKNTGRVEFGDGIMQKLVYAFCDSPYILQSDLEETLIELQDSFYYFKNESDDALIDDELIEYMKRYFDGRAGGSIEYLAGITLDELFRNADEHEMDYKDR
ncbi:MAG: DUF6323 family protein [Oscillospiraceae bacterium]